MSRQTVMRQVREGYYIPPAIRRSDSRRTEGEPAGLPLRESACYGEDRVSRQTVMRQVRGMEVPPEGREEPSEKRKGKYTAVRLEIDLFYIFCLILPFYIFFYLPPELFIVLSTVAGRAGGTV